MSSDDTERQARRTATLEEMHARAVDILKNSDELKKSLEAYMKRNSLCQSFEDEPRYNEAFLSARDDILHNIFQEETPEMRKYSEIYLILARLLVPECSDSDTRALTDLTNRVREDTTQVDKISFRFCVLLAWYEDDMAMSTSLSGTRRK